MLFLSKLKEFLTQKSGIVTIEYGLGAALIILATASSIGNFSDMAQKSLYCSTPDQKTNNATICKSFHKSSK